MRVFYYLSSCDSCKRILSKLSLDDSIAQVDVKKNPLTLDQLENLYLLSESYETLFSKRAQLYKKRNLKNKVLTEVDYKNFLLEHYTFLKRPVLVYDKKLFIGNSAKVVSAAKAFLYEQ
jgi:arsenate reductase